VKRRLVGVEAREAAYVVAEHDLRLAEPGIGANLEERLKFPPAIGVEAARIIREFSDDMVAAFLRPGPHGLPLLLNGEVLMRPRAAVESVGGDYAMPPVTFSDRIFR
jgi:hypothetical protein